MMDPNDNEDLDFPSVRFIGAAKPVPKYTFGKTKSLSNKRKRPTRYQKCRNNRVESRIAESGHEEQSGQITTEQSTAEAEQAIIAVSAVSAEVEDEVDVSAMSSTIVDIYDESSEIDHEPEDYVLDIEIQDVYMVHLLQAKSFVNIDNSFNSFLVQDFDLKRKQLMLHKFKFIERHFVKLSSQTTWLLLCSCDNNRKKFVKSLDHQSNLKKEDLFRTLSARYPDCLHISTCHKMISTMDKINNIDPLVQNFEGTKNDDHGYSKSSPCIQELVLSAERLILVKIDDMVAVLGNDSEGFVCYSCSYGRHSCRHVSVIKDMLKKNDENVPDFVLELTASSKELANLRMNSFVLHACSKEKFNWVTTPQQQAVYRLSKDSIQFVLDDGSMALIPGDDPCDNCGGPMDTVTLFDPCCKRLLLWAEIIKVKVHGRECTDCRFQRGYCGSSEGILNMKSFLVGHDVLRDYLHQFLSGNSCSLIGYYEKWKLNLTSAGIDLADMINYQQWRFSWYSFLDLLDIDYTAGFMCDICGQYPEVLTCDATALGFKKTFLLRSQLLTESNSKHPLEGRFSCRVMIKHSKLRSLLRKFSLKETLADADRKELKELLQRESLILSNFIVWCETEYECVDFIPPSILALLKCISSVSPVISYFPVFKEFRSVINEIQSGINVRRYPEKLSILQRIAPVIYDAIICLPEGELPVEMIQLFAALDEKVTWILDKEPHQLEPVDDEFTENSLSFLPSWPVINIRGTYKKDSSTSKKGTSCRKEYRGHPSLMPGIFTLYCSHDICYGFEVMQVVESPNTPFSILRTRFRQAPKSIIYDNSCHLHDYCLNRDPGFFRQTSFFVDRFHWKNHTACADSYNLSCYPDFKRVNSQINEQRNSILKKVKNQLSYMSPSNFVMHCKLMLWHCNQRAKFSLTV